MGVLIASLVILLVTATAGSAGDIDVPPSPVTNSDPPGPPSLDDPLTVPPADAPADPPASAANDDPAGDAPPPYLGDDDFPVPSPGPDSGVSLYS